MMIVMKPKRKSNGAKSRSERKALRYEDVIRSTIETVLKDDPDHAEMIEWFEECAVCYRLFKNGELQKLIMQQTADALLGTVAPVTGKGSA
jgi:hypothetical protein